MRARSTALPSPRVAAFFMTHLQAERFTRQARGSGRPALTVSRHRPRAQTGLAHCYSGVTGDSCPALVAEQLDVQSRAETKAVLLALLDEPRAARVQIVARDALRHQQHFGVIHVRKLA